MKIGVIGSGTMGAGIAQVAAHAGNQVIVIDNNIESLSRASDQLVVTLDKLLGKQKITAEKVKQIVGNIQWLNDTNTLHDADFIIEAIVENLEIKQSLFLSLESVISPSCILATNTSSLSVTSIAASCKYPERVIGVHFFNPATIMELVEIIPAIQTSSEIVQITKNIVDGWNKKTVVAKDTPGFIVNRIARPFYSESLRILEEGFANIETIDSALCQIGFRMGPFALMDLIGHDINYTVTETVWKSFYFDPKYTPSFTQKRLVEAKWFGKKSGRGFYNYQDGAVRNSPDTDEIVCSTITNRVLVMLINEAANALFLHVASKEDIDLAMTKGVNYPKGLLKWADELGIKYCVEKLDAMYKEYGEDRYRCSPLLRKMIVQQTTFFKP